MYHGDVSIERYAQVRYTECVALIAYFHRGRARLENLNEDIYSGGKNRIGRPADILRAFQRTRVEASN